MVEGSVDSDPALPPGDGGLHARVGYERGAQYREDASGVAHHHSQLGVDPGGRRHRHRLQRLGFPEQRAGEGERVDADVGQTATPQVRIEPAPLRVLIGRIAEVGLQVAHLAHRSLADQLLHPGQERKEAHPHGLHEEHPGAAGGCHHLHRLRVVQCQRLLAQHCQPGLQAGEGVGMVLVVGGGYVHRVDPAG